MNTFWGKDTHYTWGKKKNVYINLNKIHAKKRVLTLLLDMISWNLKTLGDLCKCSTCT